MAEAHYEFLLLLREFEPQRGIPFDGYISRMLPRRVLNWVQKEQCRLRREIIFVKSESEADEARMLFASCSGCDAVQEHEAELWLWWQQNCRTPECCHTGCNGYCSGTAQDVCNSYCDKRTYS